MLEAIMLKKCVIDIYINDIKNEFEPLKKGIFRIDSDDSFDEIVNIISNVDNSSKLIEDIPEILGKYVSHTKNASKNVLEFLEEIKK